MKSEFLAKHPNNHQRKVSLFWGTVCGRDPKSTKVCWEKHPENMIDVSVLVELRTVVSSYTRCHLREISKGSETMGTLSES